ncbi:hypothetical protein KRX51_09805 [Corynebacterium sp. TAE3-ERU12]|uniref:hypothetical protein n=1 Tax=Corynebacterium sp. TAE3-ERU12 TaxID=2849491 RepID=UPI001C454131|nr:hypothetical protein [Corynebacterium sp. TAE3-ERU12]MBV7296204.1 hypothetical protein [Corynebacterium sp. TAE3-ERU12]
MGKHSKPTPPRGDSVHPLMAALAVLCTIALVAVFIVAAFSDRVIGQPTINGDLLGPQEGENAAAYIARADEELAAMDGDQPRWALVSFVPAITADIVDLRVPAGSVRVGRVLIAGSAGFDVPEPTRGATRAEVIRREAGFAGGRGQPFTLTDDGTLLVSGLVVYAVPNDLRTLKTVAGVAAVEPLPEDAAYGRFGVRPLWGIE